MTSIGNQISFNNRNYDVDRTNNGQNQTTIRENFAAKLSEFSADNNISADERTQLETLSSAGTATERAIVATISKAGTAAFNPDSAAPMQPVELSFGTPNASSPPAPQSAPPPTAQSERQPDRAEAKITIGSEFASTSDVSMRMARYLNNATENDNTVGPEEFAQLRRIPSETRTPGDAEVLTNLTDLAATQANDRGARASIRIGENRPVREIRLNNTPAPEGRAGASGGAGNFIGGVLGDTFNQVRQSLPGVLSNVITGAVRDELTGGTPAPTTSTTTGGKTETPTPTPDAPVTKDKL